MILNFAKSLVTVLLSGIAVSLLAQEPPPPSNLWPAAPVPKETDATSQKIIDLHLKARGGEEALEKVDTLLLTGTVVEGLVDHSLEVAYRCPDSILYTRYRYHLGYDETDLRGTDGKQAWQHITQPEKKLPQRVGGKPASALAFDALLPFLFSKRADPAPVFTYKGEKEFAKSKAYVLHGWLPGGLQFEVFFDTRSFMIVNYRYPLRIGPTEVLIDRLPTGLVQVDDMWWENGYKLQHRAKVFQTLDYEYIGVNPEFNEGKFTMPEVKEFWLRPEE